MSMIPYIAIAIVALAVIALLLVFIGRKKHRKLSPLASVALFLIIAGIVFGESRLVGYSLIGAGVILAIIDIFVGLHKVKK